VGCTLYPPIILGDHLLWSYQILALYTGVCGVGI
jgi:hypothetical protein